MVAVAWHAFDHASILKFHAWFATTNHLWVVTEYCAGGDLQPWAVMHSFLDQRCQRCPGQDNQHELHVSAGCEERLCLSP